MNEEEKSLGNALFSFKRKFDNYWYHYKWYMIIAVFIVIFIIFAASQCSTAKKSGDVNLAYVGPSDFLREFYPSISEDFKSILEEDLDGNGEIYCELKNFLYMTGRQIENARAQNLSVNIQELMTIKQQIDNEIIAGDTVIYLMDEAAFKEFEKTEGIFMPLEEALGYQPDETVTESLYYIKFSKLYCREYFAGLYEFPESTVIAVRAYPTSVIADDQKTNERYERNLKMFKKIVEFTHPE